VCAFAQNAGIRGVWRVCACPQGPCATQDPATTQGPCIRACPQGPWIGACPQGACIRACPQGPCIRACPQSSSVCACFQSSSVCACTQSGVGTCAQRSHVCVQTRAMCNRPGVCAMGVLMSIRVLLSLSSSLCSNPCNGLSGKD